MVTPMRLIGTPNRLDSPQILRSHMIASSSPPPTHSPWIIATVGWRRREMQDGERGGRESAKRVEAIDRLDPFGSALVGPPENDLPT